MRLAVAAFPVVLLLACGCSGGDDDGGGGSGGGSSCGLLCCAAQPTNGAPIDTIAEGQNDPCGLALDGSTLFWTRLDGKVARVETSGGPPQVLYEGALWLSCSLAVSPSHVYFSEQKDGRVIRVPRDGGAPEVLSEGEADPGAFVLGAGVLYWLRYGDNAIARMAVESGGAPEVLATFDKKVGGLAVDASYAYTISGDAFDRNLYRVPLAGGAPELLASASGSGPIRVDGTQAFWLEQNLPGRVVRAPITGGTTEVVHAGKWLPLALGVDDASVYFSEGNGISNDYHLWRAPKSGGAPELVQEGLCGPYGIVLDSTRLYWTNQYDGTITSTPK